MMGRKISLIVSGHSLEFVGVRRDYGNGMDFL